MIRLALPFALLLSTGASLAQETPAEPAPAAPPALVTASSAVTLTLDSASDVERTSALYQCDNGELLPVQYINAAPNFIALVPVEGEVHLFVTTLSGSGARYVSGPFEWWNDGDETSLRDLTQGEDADPLATCTASSNTP